MDLLAFAGQDRITLQPGAMGGKACIRGLRVTVGMIVGPIGAGRSIDSLLTDYPYLEQEDILQALRYAAWSAEGRAFDDAPDGDVMARAAAEGYVVLTHASVVQFRAGDLNPAAIGRHAIDALRRMQLLPLRDRSRRPAYAATERRTPNAFMTRNSVSRVGLPLSLKAW